MFKSTKNEIHKMIVRKLLLHMDVSHPWPLPPAEKKYVCETCGCFIAPEFAVAGEKEIRQNDIYMKDGQRWVGKTDYIHKPYYCKIHAPKVKK